MDILIASSLLVLVLTPVCLAVHHLISIKRKRTLTLTRPALLSLAGATGPTFFERPPTVAPTTHSLAPQPWSVPPPALGATGPAEVQQVDLPLWDDEDDAQLDFWSESSLGQLESG